MSVHETIKWVSNEEAKKLEKMTVLELCALIGALGTLADVGTALLNAPAMTGQRTQFHDMNAAGSILDQRVDQLFRLREAAFWVLRWRRPSLIESEQYAATIINMQFEFDDPAEAVVRMAEAYAATAAVKNRDTARAKQHQNAAGGQSATARFWSEFRSMKPLREAAHAKEAAAERMSEIAAQLSASSDALSDRVFSMVRKFETSAEHTGEAAAARTLLAIWWQYSAVDSGGPEMKRFIGILRALHPQVKGVLADDVAATIEAIDRPEPVDLAGLDWFA